MNDHSRPGNVLIVNLTAAIIFKYLSFPTPDGTFDLIAMSNKKCKVMIITAHSCRQVSDSRRLWMGVNPGWVRALDSVFTTLQDLASLSNHL